MEKYQFTDKSNSTNAKMNRKRIIDKNDNLRLKPLHRKLWTLLHNIGIIIVRKYMNHLACKIYCFGLIDSI